ncbi:putative translocon-associated protein subunit beta [Blattamonas nauphoetae]|uniref:Translocon-associated protein subunit beta n=1 Tax=Blattamonas nauphoetae TaxID=2049346 RepID=A0ABQ9Y4C9_9EUKA|nr:putative translocon-associated protein subunit beta [Blattamonas nauphoetae]
MSLTLVIAALVSLVSSAPQLLVKKEVLTNPAGEGHDLKVRVGIYNVGKEDIYSVDVADNWGEFFTISPNAVNNNTCSFDIVKAETNVTCDIIVVPLRHGTFSLLSSQVQYKTSPEDETPSTVIGHPLTEQPLTILPSAIYKRFFSSHLRMNITFICLVAIAILIPYRSFAIKREKSAYKAMELR